MLLIVGLGNPGKKYQGTRHNIGHMVIDAFPQEDGFIVKKTDAFMNESGKAVKGLIQKSKVKSQNLIVAHDDIDIPIGEFKIQKGRGAAGHKGVQSVIDALGTKDFWRVRIGICPPSCREGGKPKNIEKFVLQKFTKDEGRILEKVLTEVTKVTSLIMRPHN